MLGVMMSHPVVRVPNLHDCDSDREHDQGDPLPRVQRPAQDEHREERRGEDLELVRHLVRHGVEVGERLVVIQQKYFWA